jgi:hypothetical protein
MARALALNDKRDPVGAPDFTLPVSILAQIIESLKVDIVAQTIPKLEIDIASVASGVTFNVAQSGSWTINAAQSGSWTINAIQSGTWTVNVSGTVNVNITNTSLNVNVTNSTLTVTVSGTANVNVTNSSLTVTVSGTVNVNVTNSSLTVTISGTPTINVQTSGGANIVVDKLTQGAYTERQSTLANNGATASMIAGNYTTKKGKFFPRGCRGFIRYIEIYCNNSDTVSHTLTVKASPMPGLGAVFTATISVSAGSSADWRSVWVNKPWNYDSLFIWVMSDSDSYGNVGVDTGTPYDYYYSTDEASWYFSTYRLWVRVSLSGETVGDLPVSGTVNTIQIPAVSSGVSSGNVSIPVNVETSVLTARGVGECDLLMCIVVANTGAQNTAFKIYCDGNLVGSFDPYGLYGAGFTASSPGISLLKYTADGYCSFIITKKLYFRRILEVKAIHPTVSQTVVAYAYTNMIA